MINGKRSRCLTLCCALVPSAIFSVSFPPSRSSKQFSPFPLCSLHSVPFFYRLSSDVLSDISFLRSFSILYPSLLPSPLLSWTYSFVSFIPTISSPHLTSPHLTSPHLTSPLLVSSPFLSSTCLLSSPLISVSFSLMALFPLLYLVSSHLISLPCLVFSYIMALFAPLCSPGFLSFFPSPCFLSSPHITFALLSFFPLLWWPCCFSSSLISSSVLS